MTRQSSSVCDSLGQRLPVISDRSVEAIPIANSDLSRLIDLSSHGVFAWCIRTGEMTFSSRWEARLGYDLSGFAPTVETWLAKVHSADRERLTVAIADSLRDDVPVFEDEHRVRAGDGSWRWVTVRGLVVERDDDTSPVRVIGVLNDVHLRHRNEVVMRHMASHDPLTSLTNRRMFQQAMVRTFDRQGGDERVSCLMLLDLDNFKEINDVFGHAAGDAMLRETAKRLTACVGSEGMIARLGGDEFAIIVEDTRRERMQKLAAKIVDALIEPWKVASTVVTVGASLGFALHPSDATGSNELMSRADLALYAAKSDGRNTWRAFEATMHTQAVARTTLASELKDAVNQAKLEVHYQPIIDTTMWRVSGVEALLRWNHPTRGLLTAAEFLDEARRSHVLVEMSNKAIETALEDGVIQNGAGLEMARLHLNIPPELLKLGDWLDRLLSQLWKSGLSPDRAVIEIAEYGIDHDQAIVRTLARAKAAGIAIALDDFGTGQSSLSRFGSLPIDLLKIDRAFLRSAGVNRTDAAIVESILQLANRLGIDAISEGVETGECSHWLMNAGCRHLQGYYFAHPMPRAAFLHWYERWVRGQSSVDRSSQTYIAASA